MIFTKMTASSGSKLAILGVLAMLGFMSTVHPVFAYTEGASNSWITTTNTVCNNVNYPADLGIAWDTSTPVIQSLDSGLTEGEWTWQVQVETTQNYGDAGNDVAYQFVTDVQNYYLTDAYVEALLPSGYMKESGSNTFPSSTYYVGGPDAGQNIEVEADGSWDSGNLLAGVTYYVWDNGVLQSTDIDVTISSAYYATPVSYQPVLVSTPGDTPVEFTGGTGYFYTFGTGTQTTGCTPGWGTGESSNMSYYTWPSTCNSGYTDCYQDYTVATEKPSIEVQSVNQYGEAITGYYTELDNTNYGYLASGYTTHAFTGSYLDSGTSYYLWADSYGTCTFGQWSDGNTNDPRLVTASDEMVFTADYECTGGGR